MEAPSGRQHRVEYGNQKATITEVGATLREYSLNESPVIWGFDEDVMCSGGRGQVLAPWPNRLADGFYIYRGTAGQAGINELERHNAIHGLVRWMNWSVVADERARVELECVLPPQPAYPFRLRLTIAYSLGDDGLSVRIRAESEDRRVIPFGLGFHPYFLAGHQGLAGSRLHFHAARHLVLDERGLPIADEALDDAYRAFSEEAGANLGEMTLDDCFSGLHRDDAGNAHVSFVPGGGPIAKVTLRLDSSFDYLMCFTGDTLGAADRRRAVALEPMSCPPNAFSSMTSLVELGDGDSYEASFSILPELA